MTPYEFLEKWRPGGPWVLTAIGEGSQISTHECHDEADVTAWLEQHAERNHYFHVNDCRGELKKKADRGDIRAVRALHVDVDFEGAGTDEEREAIYRRFDEHVPRPTVLIFSGGGYQAFWILVELIPTRGSVKRADELARYNQTLETTFGADHCHNVDRIMRLPGTVNRPNARKRAKGRKEARAEVIWFTEARYTLDDFVQSPERGKAPENPDTYEAPGNVRRLEDVDEIDTLIDETLADWCKALIVQGDWPDYHEKHGEDSRSERLFAACCEMVRAGVPDDVIYSVITDPDFGISASVLDKGSGTQKYAERQITQAQLHAIDPDLAALNARYAAISNYGGKFAIVEELPQRGGRFKLSALRRGCFTAAFENKFKTITVQDAKGNDVEKDIELGKWWLRHPKRRQFEQVVFDPTDTMEGYNLWRGFAVDPKAGDCSLYLAHLLDNVCCGDQEHYEYLIRWMARAVQRPGSPARTAVVLRGSQGTGKTFVAEQFGKLFGRHYLTVSNSKHLVGNFNAHLRDVVFLFGDEAFYAGDKRHQSILKTFVTEGMLQIEPKGYDMELSPNCLHIMMASNEDWVVPADIDDRRFFVLTVSDERAKDGEYFGRIAAQMDRGGREALLHYLLELDLSEFDVRKVPQTEALQAQKTHSLEPGLEWWFECLKSGYVVPDLDWEDNLPAGNMYVEFLRAVGKTNGAKKSKTAFGRLIRKVTSGEAVKKQGLEPMEFRTENGGTEMVKKPQLYILPSLERCRNLWNEVCFPYDWALEDCEETQSNAPF